MASPIVTAPMARKAAALVELLGTLSTGASKLTGQRFYVVPASNGMTAHWTAIDGTGCTCLGFQRRGLCTHQIAARALYERQAPPASQPAPAARLSYEDLVPACASGCGDVVDRKGESCYRCASDKARRLDLAARRELVANL